MEKDFHKSTEILKQMIHLIARIEINTEWYKKSDFFYMQSSCYNDAKKDIKELSDLIISLYYVESFN